MAGPCSQFLRSRFTLSFLCMTLIALTMFTSERFKKIDVMKMLGIRGRIASTSVSSRALGSEAGPAQQDVYLMPALFRAINLMPSEYFGKVFEKAMGEIMKEVCAGREEVEYVYGWNSAQLSMDDKKDFIHMVWEIATTEVWERVKAAEIEQTVSSSKYWEIDSSLEDRKDFEVLRLRNVMMRADCHSSLEGAQDVDLMPVLFRAVNLMPYEYFEKFFEKAIDDIMKEVCAGRKKEKYEFGKSEARISMDGKKDFIHMVWESATAEVWDRAKAAEIEQIDSGLKAWEIVLSLKDPRHLDLPVYRLRDPMMKMDCQPTV